MKKFLQKTVSAAAAAAMTLSVTALSAFAVVGDINNSGVANSSDARLLLRYSAHLETLTDEQLAKADLSLDGKVNSADARILLRAAAKLENLEYYSNFYTELTDGADATMAFGYYNGSLYMKTELSGAQIAVIIGADGSFTFVDGEKKQYATITAQEIETMAQLAAMQGEDFDVNEMININASAITNTIPTPLKLLDDGYERTASTWQGEAADAYSNDNATYYFQGKKLLATVVKTKGADSVTTYRNFTSQPYDIIYAHLNPSSGYQKVDFIEMIMTMSAISF